MDSDIQHLEETLTQLTPQPMSADLLARLDHAMCNVETVAQVEEVDVVEELSRLEPSPISPELIARLDDAMSRWHESVPVEEKVIPLNQSANQRRESSNWLGWKSAAAVGILGAAMALVIGGNPVQPTSEAAQEMQAFDSNSVAPASYSSYAFKPRNTQRNIVGAAERGFTWTEDGQIVRCLEVEVSDQMDFRNARGEIIRIRRPRTELVFEPLTVD